LVWWIFSKLARAPEMFSRLARVGLLFLACCFHELHVLAVSANHRCIASVAAVRCSEIRIHSALFVAKNPVIFDFCIGKSSSGIHLCIDMRRSCLPTRSLRSGLSPGLFPLRRASQKKSGLPAGKLCSQGSARCGCRSNGARILTGS